MTTIQDCSYSSNHPAVPQAQLAGKINLLQSGATHDISRRIGRLVTCHLGYLGNAVYQIKLTKTRIDFTVATAPNEQRTLEKVSGRWMLSQGTAAATSLAQGLQSQVTDYVIDILADIRAANAAHSSAQVASPAAPVASPVIHTAAPVDLGPIHARLDDLNRRIDQILLGSTAPRPDAFRELHAHYEALHQSVEELQRAQFDQTGKLQEQLKEATATAAQNEAKAREALEHVESELKKVQQQVQLGDQEVQKLTAALAAAQQAQIGTEAKVDDLAVRLYTLGQEQKVALSKIESLTNENAAMMRDLEAVKTLTKEHEALQTQAKKFQQSIEALQVQLQEKTAVLELNQQTLAASTEQNTALKRSQAEQAVELEQVQQQVQLGDQEVQKLTAALAAARSTSVNVQTAIEKLKVQLKTLTSESATQITALNKENADQNLHHEQTAATLQQQLTAFQARDEEAQQSIEALQAQLTEKTALLEKNQQILAASLEQNAALAENKTKHESERKVAQETIQRDAQEIQNLTAKLAAAQQALEEAEEAGGALDFELLNLSEQQEASSSEITKLTKDNAALERQHKSDQLRNGVLVRNVGALEKEKAALELRHEADQLRNRVLALNLEATQKALEEAEGTGCNFALDLLNLSEQQEASSSEITKLTKDNAALERQHEGDQLRIAGLALNLEAGKKLEREHKEVQAKAAETERKVEALQAQLREKTTQQAEATQALEALKQKHKADQLKIAVLVLNIETVKKLERELTKLQEKTRVVAKENLALEQAKVAIQQSLDSALESEQASLAKVTEVNQDIESLQREILRLQKETETCDIERKRLKKPIADLPADEVASNEYNTEATVPLRAQFGIAARDFEGSYKKLADVLAIHQLKQSQKIN